jgi:peptide/nickel transport system permease protein
MSATVAERIIERTAGELPPLRRRRVPVTPSGAIGLAIVGLLVVLAIFGSWLEPFDPAKQQLSARLQKPVGFGGSWSHPLGTDQLGRDLLSRVIAGARLSLTIGLIATAAAATIGVTLGLLAGLSGGRIDRAIVFLLDVALALPFIVIAIAVVAALGGGLTAMMLTLIGTGWVGYARILRLQTRALRHVEFVDAARAMGASRATILRRHLLPNVAGTVIVLASQQIAGMIVYAAALSYLGLGLSSDRITWGGLVASGQEILLVAWWPALMPGIALVLTVIGFALIGDALRAAIERR